jgi:outer membrane protein TolC
MKMFLFVYFFTLIGQVYSQSLNKVSDSTRNLVNEYKGNKKTLSEDERIVEKLLKLALKNPQIASADANLKIAEISRKKAGSSLLNSISAAGNINEFTINGTAAAAFYPKYNLGIIVPFDIFARTQAEKNSADQMIIINTSQRLLIEANLKARVLIQYELYKEKKQLVELQKIAMEDDIAAYVRAQKDFKENNIMIEELNRIYKTSIVEKAILATKEKDLNVAIIQLEEIIGTPIKTVLEK